MVYELLSRLLRKHLYLVFHERYKNENASIYIERFGAKHPLLKPELIVVNDQVHGFKKQNDRYLGLEKFPIFVELEYADDEGEKLVEGIDIHAEANIKLKDKLRDVVKMATYFEKTVVVERTRLLTDSSEESLIIYSKIGEMYAASYIEDDLDEGELSEDELTAMIEKYLTSFTTFLQALDELTGRRKKSSVLDGLVKLDGNE